MTVLRSNVACRRSTAILSLPSVTSPRNVSGRISPCVASVRPSSQAASTLGSPASISAGPVKLTPSPATARWPLNFTCVKPGARNSKRSRFHPLASVLMSPRTFVTLLPPRLTWSMPMPIWIGTAGRKAPPASSAILRMAAAGGGRTPSLPASTRSRSIWRPDSTPSKRGFLPNLKSATPVSLSACSSEPYWNSNCSIKADTALTLTLPLTCQGWVTCAALRGAMPTGRVRLKLPSNLGCAPASASMPSASMLSG